MTDLEYHTLLLKILWEYSEDIMPKAYAHAVWVAPSFEEPVGFAAYMNCNDMFDYATADSERIPREILLDFLYKWTNTERDTWCCTVRNRETLRQRSGR